MTKRAFLLIAAIVLLASGARAITAQEAVNRFAFDPSMKHASLTVMFMDIDSGNVIAAHNPDLSVGTASTMKTVTSTTALEVLGGDFRFETKVYAYGQVLNDTLRGNLLIVGSGDPTLGTRYMRGIASMPDEIVSACQQLGIKAIDGRVLTDTSLYPTIPYSSWWDAGDLAQDYGAGVHSINYKDNYVKLNFNIDRKGTVKDARLIPEVPGVTIVDKTRPGVRNFLESMLEYGTQAIAILGTTATGKGKTRHSWDVVIPNPEALLVADVEKALADAGIVINHNEKALGNKDKTVVEIVNHKSPVLTDIIESLLDRSDNMYTHALLRAVGVRSQDFINRGGEVSNAGVNVVREVFKKWGDDCEALFMKDGSGLARVDKGSGRMFCNMLRYMAYRYYNGKRLTDLMSRAGNRVGKILPTTELSKTISLKSGSMSDVQCFVGYYPADAPKVAWCILANNYSCSRSTLRDNMDRMLIDVLTPQPEPTPAEPDPAVQVIDTTKE